MLRLSLIILCVSTTIGQRKGNRYVRLPSGYTFAEPSSSDRLSKIAGSKYGFGQTRDQARYQIGPSATQPQLLSNSPGYHAGPPLPYVQQVTNAPTYLEVLTQAPTATSLVGEGIIAGGTISEGTLGGEGTAIGQGAQIGGEGTAGEGTAGEGTAGEGTAGEGTAGEGTAGEGTLSIAGSVSTSAPQHIKLTKSDTSRYINDLHVKNGHRSEADKHKNIGHTFTSLGGGQFYQSLFGGKNGFSPLSFFLQNGRNNAPSPFLIPVPIVVPPPPPPPPGPKCYTNPSGFLCCNVTLEKTMEMAYLEAKSEGISLCNVQKMATAVQEAAEKKFAMSFESIVGHKDFVAKVNFAGDLNCKIEVDGKFFLAYATPTSEEEVNIIDANSFFSGDAEELLENHNGTDGKPTYIVYGPIR